MNLGPLQIKAKEAALLNIEWMVGSFSHDGNDQFRVEGWATSSNHHASRLLLNGQPIKLEYPIKNAELEALYPVLPQIRKAFFIGTAKLPLDELYRSNLASLEWQRDGKQTLQSLLRRVYHFDPRKEPPLPPAENIMRVIGTDRADLYTLAGATTVGRFNHYISSMTGIVPKRILDWGCGSGRLTRYLAATATAEVIGADIDRVNIEWSKKHLPKARFELVKTAPPMPFSDNYFDAVVGISVFTHLREADQFEWLKELKRVMRPGGVALVSFAGPAVLGVRGAAEETLESVAKNGFLFSGANTEVQDGLAQGDKEFYCNVVQSPHYIMSEWSRYFDVKIEPGLGDMQDWAVLTKTTEG